MANPSKMNPNRQDEYASESYLRRIKAEIRKTNKPIMEKKRRARINHYLNDLKGLLLDAMKKDPVRHSKLEKADILDLTVKHLQDIERRRLAVAMAVDPSVPEKFATGYRECIDEISKYFDSLGSVDEGLKGRVRKHLEGCLAFPPKMGQGGYPAGVLGPFGGPASFAGMPLNSPDDVNNNTQQGLLNRVFANNLSLGMFPTVPLPSVPFAPFPFFGPLRAPSSGTLPCHPALGGALDLEGPELRPTVSGEQEPQGLDSGPSPPASPTGTAKDTKELETTPAGKSVGTLGEQQHTMERLLAIFPTPPSPEDQRQGRRFGKLGHHFDASPFVPTGRTPATGSREDIDEGGDGDERRMDEGQDESQESDREEEEEGRRTKEKVAKKRSAPDDGKQDGPGGEMWRPW